MPIELADYTKPIRDRLRRGGYACVYVLAAETHLSRVGYAIDLAPTATRLRRSSPVPIVVHDALWVPDRGIATNIARAVQCDMMPVKRDNGWHAAPAETMRRALELAAFRIHPGASMVWHEHLMQQRHREPAA